ncbi:biotin--[acetyl-CoA-carboxylase] ligase [Actinoplanes sp. NBRC 103695]|uniref:biotin--[acetyl-CoA-carboxylase] ligase n=1 Tax=Actinoplanes sp. NBRC 103695 TaxID=3032202 RepID=UPI0024A22A85|nr:biotin--[acetyl-CoA-carboxylase] ligase [Actinoplanes sp. NBRC 103695]GLY95652.1 biotin--[acetyl-CoA-carboxylase] ligase [Actinoplanes sp. NBRC 103695]
MSSPYRDLDRPPLSSRSLERALLVPGGLWRRLDIRAATGSTNADATEAALAGEPEGLVVVAEQQVAGRGRRDRTWVSPPGAGLTLSVLLRPGDVPSRRWGWLPLLAGVALRDAVHRITELDATLKWPNDLLVHDQQSQLSSKCAGILAEVAGDAVVVGIGLNVTTRVGELPPVTGLPATSLQIAGAKSTDREPLVKALLRSLEQWYVGWRDAGGDAEMCGLLGAYRRGCSTIGRDVRVELPAGDDVVGAAVDVDADGQLVVRTADGVDNRVSAGDVRHVR